MTHILNHALRDVLIFQDKTCKEVRQMGSLVDEERTRFDFTSNALTDKQVEKVQQQCRDVIKQNLTVFTKEVAKEQGGTINSLRSVFGEKYPDFVRVVSVGLDVDQAIKDPNNEENMKYSVEYCGGTHIGSTGEAGNFTILAEESIAKGVRRVVAVTGKEAAKAAKHAAEVREMLKDVSNQGTVAEQVDACRNLEEVLKDDTKRIPYLTKKDVQKKIAGIKKEWKKLEKARMAKVKDVAVATASKLADEAKSGGQKFVVAQLDCGVDAKTVLAAIKAFHKVHKIPVLFVSVDPDQKKTKVLIKAEVPKAMSKEFSAKAWVQSVQDLVSGHGGGKPTSGTCNGTDPTKITEVIAKAVEFAGTL